MNKEELFSNAEKYKKNGDFLLQESRLLPFLSHYGEVTVSGSYSIDLMVNGDIDLYVVLTKFQKETVVEILNRLIEQDYFRGFYYGDYIKHLKDGFPSGHYIGLNKMHNNDFWKFDLWFVEKTDNEKDEFMRNLQEKLTEDTRYEILRRKQERSEKKQETTSFEIYQEVVEL